MRIYWGCGTSKDRRVLLLRYSAPRAAAAAADVASPPPPTPTPPPTPPLTQPPPPPPLTSRQEWMYWLGRRLFDLLMLVLQRVQSLLPRVTTNAILKLYSGATVTRVDV